VEFGPNGLWRLEEALEAMQTLAKAGEQMSAYNQRLVCSLQNKPLSAVQGVRCDSNLCFLFLHVHA
jgi:hypothetical protein